MTRNKLNAEKTPARRARERLTGLIGGSTLVQTAHTIRASYWFIPTIMVVCAILLSALTQWLDGVIDPGWLEGFEWLYSNETVGARAVLSTIASSMVTVAGVTFSMTIVSVSFASAQFGPRLINNFMRDRGNQLTLGTFISTFVYCLMVLRGVRDGIEDEDIVAFIPHISVLAAMLLAVLSIAVLIFFIHHVPETINVGNIISNIGQQLRQAVTEMFPETEGSDAASKHAQGSRREFDADRIAHSSQVACHRSGYVSAIDTETIFSIACEHDLTVRVEFIPGDFALEGETALHVWPDTRATKECLSTLQNTITFSSRPGTSQNARFLVDQLVEIIGRALSPGVNDPYTAINCINLLMDSLAVACRTSSPSGVQTDEAGNDRIVTNPYDFARLAAAIFEQSAQYVAPDRNVTLHAMHMIATVGAQSDMTSHREILRGHAERLCDIASAEIRNPTQVSEIARAKDLVVSILDGHADVLELREGRAWLGGSG